MTPWEFNSGGSTLSNVKILEHPSPIVRLDLKRVPPHAAGFTAKTMELKCPGNGCSQT